MDEETRRKMQADADAEHNRIIEIGGMRFGEGQSDLGREREAARQNRDQSETFTIPSETVTVAEAHQIFDFPFGVPTWKPDGFTMNDKVSISSLFKGSRTPHVRMYWSHPDKRHFELSIHPCKNVPNIVYGPHSVEAGELVEIQVNGQPAVLINQLHSYRPSTGETFVIERPCLIWMIDYVEYELYCSNNVLSTEEMIRIAESARHEAT
jgi:hypothetical protein